MCARFRVQGSGTIEVRVHDVGIRVYGLGFRVRSFRFRV
jgi:hypothetical protein